MTARRANKLDSNHKEIADALAALPGVRVASLAPLGGGIPDLMVGLLNAAGRPVNLLLEVKVPNGPKAKRRWVLTDDQERWHKAWTGQVCVVCSVSEALAVVETARRGG